MALQTLNISRTVIAPIRSGLRFRWFRRRNLALIIPAGILLFLIAACYCGPALFHLGPPSDGNLANANLPVSWHHWLGTDPLGNDILTRCLFGGRASFEIGFGAVGLGFIVGSSVGLTAGFFGGKIEIVIMRTLDILLAFPALILALALAAYLGPSILTLIAAISFFTVPTYARITRAQVLRNRGREYVIVARVMGGRPWYIAYRHVYPNVLPTLLTFAPLGIGVTMLVEAALSYLGVGIRPPEPSWGNMIAQAQAQLSQHPTDVIFPGLFLLVTITCLNLVGEQIRIRWAK
jgi:peptide/nickel transport system permease protein